MKSKPAIRECWYVLKTGRPCSSHIKEPWSCCQTHALAAARDFADRIESQRGAITCIPPAQDWSLEECLGYGLLVARGAAAAELLTQAD